jgi:hypothetical protein
MLVPAQSEEDGTLRNPRFGQCLHSSPILPSVSCQTR